MKIETFNDKDRLQMGALLEGLDNNFQSLANTSTYMLESTKSNGVYTLSFSEDAKPLKTGVYSCIISISNDYEEGDTFAVSYNDEIATYETKTSDGEILETGSFVAGVKIPAIIDLEEKTINFKLAGSKLKFLADSYLMVKCFTKSQTFTVPKTGTYRITCIGRGGYGGSAQEIDTYGINGAGGGAGAAGSLTIRLKRGEKYSVTIDDAIASFGTLITAEAGQNADVHIGTGDFNTTNKDDSYTIPGEAATMQQKDGVVSYVGRDGTSGTSQSGLISGGYRDMKGGHGGGYDASNPEKYSNFLVAEDTPPGDFSDDLIDPGNSSPTTSSPSGLSPFGVGGSGQNFIMGSDRKYPHTGKGGDAAVIVEYVIDSLDLPSIKLIYNDANKISQGASFTLYANASSKNIKDGDSLQYIWFENGKEISNTNAPYLSIYKKPNITNIEYKVRVFDGFGVCEKSVIIKNDGLIRTLSNGCSYTFNMTSGSGEDYKDDGKKLTDDDFAQSSTYKNKKFVGFKSGTNPEVTVDLKTEKLINRVCTDVITGQSGTSVLLPDSVNFKYSIDKETWYDFGEWKCPTFDIYNYNYKENQCHLIASAFKEELVKARYVKVVYNKPTSDNGDPKGWTFTSEIQVYGES